MQYGGNVCRLVAVLLLVCATAWGGPSIRLEYAVFDPAKLPPEIASLQAKAPASPYRIVQCNGPIVPKWRKQIEATGAAILGYIPDFAYLVRVDAESESALKKLPFVRWIGPYLPEYKFRANLAQSASDEPSKMTAVLFDGADAGALSAGKSIAGAAILPSSSKPGSRVLRVLCKPSDVRRLAQDNSVQWIERYVEPELQNNVARGILNVPTVWSDPGLYGSGQIVAVCDTGLDTGDPATLSPDFSGQLRSVYSWGRQGIWSDPHGHGTHVSGTVLGTGRLSGSTISTTRSESFAGVAPRAQLVMQSLLDSSGGLGGIPLDLGDLFQQAYDDGARIHTNSWGAAISGEYTADSQEVDRFVWEHQDMLVLFAAGNAGTDKNRDGKVDGDSINSPATAKNCISVGATESVRSTGGLSGTYYDVWKSTFPTLPIKTDCVSDDPEGLAAFSSRGPCDDGRIKPDICAPGTNIVSCRSHCWGATTGWGIYDSNHIFMGGTSMATPMVAGSAALVREYFVSTMGWPSVSAAMIKAAIINGAKDLTPGQYGTGATQEVTGRPDNSQGWGRVDVESTVRSGKATADYQDNTTGLATGESATFYYTASAGDGLRFTLTYNDYPALLGAGTKLVNDLDLVVIDPNGVRRYPNRLTTRDSTNPGEDVEIPVGTGVGGVYAVTVSAYNVPYGPQPFALVSRVRPGVPDVTMTMSISPEGEVRSGQTITYTASMVNRGVATSGTQIWSAIPAGTSYVPNSTRLNGVVAYDVSGTSPIFSAMSINSRGAASGVIAQSSSVVVSFKVTVNAGTPAGSIITNAMEIYARNGVSERRSASIVVTGPRVVRVKRGMSGDGSSWEAAVGTIGEGLALARPGDEVWVASDVYPENVAVGAGVALYGGFRGDEESRNQRNWNLNRAIIDGKQAGSVVTCVSGTDPQTRIDGFTICNGYAEYGCAFYCDGSSPTIANNRIIGSNGTRGGIYCRNSTAVIANNMIMANSVAYGAAVYSEASTPTICNNTIVENRADFGAALYSCSSSVPTVVNNIIAFNSSGICKGWDDSIVLRNNCTFSNAGNDYSGFYTNPVGSSGNISTDPRLQNRSGGNLHIRLGSPCIDSGDDTVCTSFGVDYDGEVRVQGGHVDIGSDEYNGADVGTIMIVVRVSPDGDDANDGASWGSAKATLQAAIHAASASPGGGEVWVKEGAYYQCITLLPYAYLYGGFSGDEILRSQRSPKTRLSILDGKQSSSVINVQSSSTWYCVDGFVIRNGNNGSGGGIFCYRGASPRIANNVVIGNIAVGNGGGIYCDSSSPEICNNRLIGNYATDGGAIYCCAQSSPIIHDNAILGNSAGHSGGGLCCWTGSPRIINNTFAASVAYFGGSMSFDSATPLIANNVIAHGSSGIQTNSSSTTTLRCNLAYDNAGKNYDGWTNDPTGTDGNVLGDPLFESLPYGNTHIRDGSACRDAGDNALIGPGWTDIDGESRSIDGHVDIGADEGGDNSWPTTPVIVRVSISGDDANDGLRWGSAMRSVQEGILAAATYGGEVWVGAGVYDEHIRLLPFSYVYGGFYGDETERSQRDWRANATILDVHGVGRPVIAQVGDCHSAIDGFTIRNGFGEYGGGIYCRVARPTISHNTICSNTATYGGGVYCYYADAEIRSNTIAENVALSVGGGMGGAWCSPAIVGNIIKGNTAASASGVHCGTQCHADIVNNIIVGNSSGNGSGAGIGTSDESQSKILNNTVVGNISGPGWGALGAGPSALVQNNIVAFNSSGILGSLAGPPVLRNNCVYGNGADYLRSSPGQGDISLDPVFVDRAGGDLHLRPWSPCIDAGNDIGAPAYDKDGAIRPQDGRIGGVPACDIGAYESPLDIGGARVTYPEGASVSIGGIPVTAVFPLLGRVYVEKKDRSTGIRIDTAEQVGVGDIINLTGTMRSDVATGERYIEALVRWPETTGDTYLCDPIAMPIRRLRASPLVPGESSLGNSGLLVRIWGRVADVSAGEPEPWVMLNDGSKQEVKVALPFDCSDTYTQDDWLQVTGIICRSVSDTGLANLVRAVDVTVVNRPGSQ